MFNKDIAYALSRLSGTWVKLKDDRKLFQVGNLKNNTNNFDEAVVDGKDELGNYLTTFLKNIEFEPGRLGYINPLNANDVASYCVRTPKREDWRQGIRVNQLLLMNNGSYRYANNDWFNSNISSIKKTIFNEFPSFDEVLSLIEEYFNCYAFSRNHLVNQKYEVFYKGFKVGKINNKDRIKLDYKFNFCREELIETVGEQNLEL